MITKKDARCIGQKIGRTLRIESDKSQRSGILQAAIAIEDLIYEERSAAGTSFSYISELKAGMKEGEARS